MGTCWPNLLGPTPSDILSMKTVYGIPHNPTISKVNDVGVIRLSVENRSTYNDTIEFDLYKWNGISYIFLRTYTVPGSPFAVGSIATVDLNVLVSDGPGTYDIGSYVYQSFPNGTTGWQSGGYSADITVADAPYKSYIPLVIQ